MTLKKATLLAGILMAAVSCSMEDELIPINNNGNGDGDKYATLSVKVNELNATTKAGGDSQLQEEALPDNTLSTASLILFNNDDDTNPTVYMAWDGLGVNENAALTWGNGSPVYQLKIAKDITGLSLRAMVVANTTQAFADCANLAAVRATVQNTDDLNQFVKVSPVSEPFDLVITETLAEATATPTVIPKLTVTNIGAVIQFIGFKSVSFDANTLTTDVYIQSLAINNLKRSTYTQLNAMDDSAIANDGVTYTTTENQLGTKLWDRTSGSIAITETFKTFANNDAQEPISMALTLTYGDRTYAVPAFIINRPTEEGIFTNGSIQSGQIYQVQLNAQLKGELLQCSFLCYTRDWIYESFSFDLAPVETTTPQQPEQPEE